MKKYQLGVIGAGNMAEAIGGLILIGIGLQILISHLVE